LHWFASTPLKEQTENKIDLPKTRKSSDNFHFHDRMNVVTLMAGACTVTCPFVTHGVFSIKRASNGDEDLCKVREDAPIVRLVGIGHPSLYSGAYQILQTNEV
jgi:hypothetical protein